MMQDASLLLAGLALLLACQRAAHSAVVRPTVFSDLNSSSQEAQLSLQQPSGTALADGPQTPGVRINPFKSRFCTAPNGARTDGPLGLQSLALDDLALSASSYSNEQVGPHLARLNLDISGGAWCPMKPISSSNFGKEWIQVKLNRSYVVNAIETQGRFGMGNGKEFVPSYQVEYSRNNGQSWHKWKDLRGLSMLRANEDVNSPVRNELSPPIVGANVIRILPYSQHLRTVCLRLELHGCPYDEGAPIAYSSSDGVVEPRWGHLIDYTYDGQRQRGLLSHGLGQLVDGVRGADNFSHNNGFEWVGWKSMNGDVWIEFTFRTLRNFTGALFHSNNLFSSGVEVFQAVDVHYGIDVQQSLEPLRDALAEQRRRDALLRPSRQLQHQPAPQPADASSDTLWSTDVLSIEYEPDKKLEQSRPVTVHLKQRLANKLRFQLKFASKWILVSEVEFLSHPVELMSLGSLSDQYTPPLLAALAPAKSYDEYVAILREHQLRRIATTAYLDSMAVSSPAITAEDSPSPPTSTGAEDYLLSSRRSPNLGMIWQGEQPATNPLLSGAPAFGPDAPTDFPMPQPPLDAARGFLPPPLLARPPTTLPESEGPQKASQAKSSQAGLATVISFVLVALLLILGLLFAVSTYKLRQAPKLGSPTLHSPYQVGSGPPLVVNSTGAGKSGLHNFMSVFGGQSSPSSTGSSHQHQPLHPDHYSAIYAGLAANHEQLGQHQLSQHQQRTLRRLATMTHSPKQQQLLVSLKDQPLFSSGTHKPQAVSTQLIMGLNQPPANPLVAQQQQQQQIYNNSSSNGLNCAGSNQTYATHYSTSMSMASSSTNGHQGDYNEYAIPDVQLPIVPARLNQPNNFGQQQPTFGEQTTFGLHRPHNNNNNNNNNQNC